MPSHICNHVFDMTTIIKSWNEIYNPFTFVTIWVQICSKEPKTMSYKDENYKCFDIFFVLTFYNYVNHLKLC
jgi:hypothetical protein